MGVADRGCDDGATARAELLKAQRGEQRKRSLPASLSGWRAREQREQRGGERDGGTVGGRDGSGEQSAVTGPEAHCRACPPAQGVCGTGGRRQAAGCGRGGGGGARDVRASRSVEQKRLEFAR